VNRPTEAASIAAALSRVAKNCREDQVSGVLAIRSALKAELSGAVPEASRSYWSACDDILHSKISGFWLSRKLGTGVDWADCLDELASGFLAASK
jgi:hypothetical protein